MDYQFNDEVQFICNAGQLVVKVTSVCDDFDVTGGHYFKAPLASKEVAEVLRILSRDKGAILLSEQIIINKQNDLLTVSLLLDYGEVVQWSKRLAVEELEGLIAVLNPDHTDVITGAKYE